MNSTEAAGITGPGGHPGQVGAAGGSDRRAAWRRLGWLLALIAALAVAAGLLPLHKIPDTVSSLGWWGPVIGAAVGALLLAALVPRTAVTIACGAVYGVLGGGLVAEAAALLGAAITFLAGRRLGRDAVAALAGRRWARLDAWLTRRGLVAVIAVRLIPIAPYGLVGYAYATTSVRVRHYAVGTLIASTPSAFTYAAVGAAATTPGSLTWISLLPAAAGAVLTLAAAVYWRGVSRHERDSTGL